MPVTDLLPVSTSRRQTLTSHDEVVVTSIGLLQEHGAGGLTMRKLASHLGVSLPTVYAAIGSRDALVRDILVVMSRRLVEDPTVQQAAAMSRPAAILGAIHRWTTVNRWILDLVSETSPEALGKVWSLVEASGVTAEQFSAVLANATGAVVSPQNPAALVAAAVYTFDFLDRLVRSGWTDPSAADDLAARLLSTVLEQATAVSSAA